MSKIINICAEFGLDLRWLVGLSGAQALCSVPFGEALCARMHHGIVVVEDLEYSN